MKCTKKIKMLWMIIMDIRIISINNSMFKLSKPVSRDLGLSYSCFKYLSGMLMGRDGCYYIIW